MAAAGEEARRAVQRDEAVAASDVRDAPKPLLRSAESGEGEKGEEEWNGVLHALFFNAKL